MPKLLTHLRLRIYDQHGEVIHGANFPVQGPFPTITVGAIPVGTYVDKVELMPVYTEFTEREIAEASRHEVPLGPSRIISP